MIGEKIMKWNKRIWYHDYYRSTDDNKFIFIHFLRDYLLQHRLRFIICFRKAQNSNTRIKRAFYNFKLYRYSRKYGIEIKSETKIGKGFVLVHPYNITVTPYAKIGNNVSMLKGSTIGISGGKKRGAPTIGDNVYIGLNSTVVGKICIGNDVVIAPNTFVNQDIPSHSVVIGNPCIIIPKENATEEYIWKKV